MELELIAGSITANVLAAAALTWTPVWVRPETYFGVRVSPEYRGSPQARRTRRSFRFKIWLATAFAVALSIVASAKGLPWLSPIGFLIQLASAIVAFRDGWRETEPHGLQAPSGRTAHLFAPPPRVPGGAVAVVTPFMVLAAVSLYLLSNWQAIPLRFPVHWDLQGHANGWSNRSFLGVFGPLLIAVVILIFMSGVITVQVHAARRAPAGSALERRNRAMLIIPVIVMWIIAIMFSLAALTPLILRNGQFPVPAFVLILVPIAVVIAGIWLAARASAGAGELPDDHTPNECWKWGQFYYNPEDSSILVERRFGLGYTFNFARWQSWLMLGGILALPVAIILLAQH
jgi:hypothetical protein